MDIEKLVTAATDYFTAGAEYYRRSGGAAPADPAPAKERKTRAPKAEPTTPPPAPAAEGVDPKKAEAAANDAAKRLMQRFPAKMPDQRPEGFHKAIALLKEKFGVGALAELSPEGKMEFVAACDAIQAPAATPSLTV